MQVMWKKIHELGNSKLPDKVTGRRHNNAFKEIVMLNSCTAYNNTHYGDTGINTSQLGLIFDFWAVEKYDSFSGITLINKIIYTKINIE